VHEPLHVTLHVPAEQTMLEPAPTVTVHEVPEHVTLLPGPPEPEHVELAWYVSFAAAACDPKSHIFPSGQSQESPLQMLEPPHATASNATAPKAKPILDNVMPSQEQAACRTFARDFQRSLRHA